MFSYIHDIHKHILLYTPHAYTHMHTHLHMCSPLHTHTLYRKILSLSHCVTDLAPRPAEHSHELGLDLASWAQGSVPQLGFSPPCF